jgi:ATP-binding protein involved in chromosome partitioning
VPQPTTAQILDALRAVQDPDLHQDIVSLGFVTKHEVEGGRVNVIINLTTPACPVKDELKKEAERVIRAVPGVTDVSIEMTAVVKGMGGSAGGGMLPGIAHIIAVSSGKGGVGKSTATVNLACALQQTGARVGILDCDVYGPDIPMMMGLAGQPQSNGQKIEPKERHGVKTMSIGYMVEEDKPIMWRGPMIHKFLEQFLRDVNWGELDYLLVDMPPGTGDAQISLAQVVPLSGAVLVTTPQAVSTLDVSKAIAMFKQVNVEVLGIIENMAGFAIEGRVPAAAGGEIEFDFGDQKRKVAVAADGRFATEVQIFGSGGAARLAAKYGFPVLGTIPLDPAVRVGGDGGDPVVISKPDSLLAERFRLVAGKFAQRLAMKQFSLPILQ